MQNKNKKEDFRLKITESEYHNIGVDIIENISSFIMTISILAILIGYIYEARLSGDGFLEIVAGFLKMAAYTVIIVGSLSSSVFASFFIGSVLFTLGLLKTTSELELIIWTAMIATTIISFFIEVSESR